MRRHAAAAFAVLLLAGCEGDPAAVDGANGAKANAPILKVGARDIRAPLPDGFCAIDPKHGADARLKEVLQAAQQAGGVTLLLIFADCKELEAWREGRQGTLDRFGVIGAPTALLDKDVAESPAAFALRIKASFEQQGLAEIDRAREAMNRRLAQISGELRVNETRPLGVLATDNRASFIGVIQNVRSEFGDTKLVAGVIGIGAVGRRALRFELYATAADAGGGAIDALLARAQRGFAALAAAN